MKKNLYLIFAVIAASIFLFSCQKDDISSTIGNGGTAVFKLMGAPSGCSPASITGVYATGNAMILNNTVTVEVDVISKGTYSFKTTSANGIYFTTSGTFTSTGTQMVVFNAVGTPIKEGSYVYATTNNSACNFTIDFVAGTGGGGGGGGSTAAFTYIGGTGSCTAPAIAGTYMNTVALNASNTVDLAINVTTIGAYSITTNSASGISFRGTGNFTSTGAQTVRLTGQGTPNATGSATFTPTGGCNFSITIVASAPAAVFITNCAVIPPVVTGIYTAGTALNATNTIIIAVNVSTPGTYSVTTGAANGVIFSASGVFSSTGANTITLTSTNTPTAAGSFAYTPSGTGGCAFNVTYGTGGGGGSNFLKSTINGGAVIDFNDRLTAANTPGSPPIPNALAIDGYVNATGTEHLIITALDDMNPITTRAYPNINISSFFNGCAIIYVDAAGSTWQSSLLSSNSFTLNVTTLTATKVTGNFNGKVYDATNTNFKTLNGSFSITF